MQTCPASFQAAGRHILMAKTKRLWNANQGWSRAGGVAANQGLREPAASEVTDVRSSFRLCASAGTMLGMIAYASVVEWNKNFIGWDAVPDQA